MKYQKKSILKVTFVCFTILFLYSCGNNSNQAKKEIKSPLEKIKKGSSMVSKIRSLNAEKDALKKLKPATVEDFENWLPETVLGLQKTKGGAIQQDGIVGVNAEYIETNNQYGKSYAKKMNILIIDGRGEKGALAVTPFIAIQHDNINKQKSDGYTKTKTIDGTIVKEEYNSNDKSYKLSFLYNKHFGVEMKMNRCKEDELWPMVKALNLQKLENY